MRARLVVLLSIAASCVACEALPDVTFDDDAVAPDASSAAELPPATSPLHAEDASDPSDAAPERDASDAEPTPAHDAGPSPQPPPEHDAGSAPDAAKPPPIDAGPGSGGSCPLVIPRGADGCCLGVPCVGKKCASRCADCTLCADAVCCVPNGKGKPTTCASAVDQCPKD